MGKQGQNERRRTSISRKLFWSVALMFAMFIISMLLFQFQREKEFSQEKLNSSLVNYNHQLHKRLFNKTDYESIIDAFTKEIRHTDIRITIISPTGEVIYDNNVHDQLENHNDRSEVAKARREGEAFSIRSSETTGKRYFYSASNIEGFIYRTALPYDKYVQTVLKVDKGFIYFIAVITLLFIFVLSRFSLQLGKTISKLRNFAGNMDTGKPTEGQYHFPDDELGDISQNIITLYKKQQKAKNALSMEREKIFKHFQYSKEGFAMFSADNKEILSNTLFIQYVNLISDTQINKVEDVLQVKELEPINDFLSRNTNNSHPNNSQRRTKILVEGLTLEKEGKIFLIESILFLDNTHELSIKDISRSEEETRVKRQLTQNIAHELKTPVSSIQGYLETILTNPNLQEEKRKFFLERAYSQSTRLTDLLRDISVLNRLDEAAEMFELKEINLHNIITEIRKECSKEMDERNIQAELILPNTPIIYGNNSLLYSIFRNLFDNAIAYAGDNIKITVNCYREDLKYYYFSFSDNGIGIDEGHINRIFERFYRIDKGRSRKIGGTGLGLSIVKNGVNFHKGQISAKSSSGKGTTFFFTLKKKI